MYLFWKIQTTNGNRVSPLRISQKCTRKSPPVPGIRTWERFRPPYRFILGYFSNSPSKAQYLKVWYRSSVIVFRSWQCLHNGCQLFLSQKSCWLPRCGSMWSTTVAFTYLGGFCFIHSAHKGCACRNNLLAFLHRALYPRFEADRITSGCAARCSSQYMVP